MLSLGCIKPFSPPIGNSPGPKKEWGANFAPPEKWAQKGQLPMGGVGLCSYSRREDWYSGNAGDIGGVERALAVCIFGRGSGDWKGPAVCIFERAFPPKKERAVLRAAPSQVSARLAAVLVRWSVK